jgi:hypothetical protein
MDLRYGPCTSSQYDVRPCKPCDYSHLHATLENIALTQCNLKRSLETFGKAGLEAVRKKLRQLHERDVLCP